MKFYGNNQIFFILVLIFAIIVATSLVAGCITISKNVDAEPETAGMETPDAHEILVPDPGGAAATQRETKSTVVAAEPFLPGDDKKLGLAFPPDLEIGSSDVLGTLFEEKRSIVLENYAYVVDVASPPLVLWFDVEPRYDDTRESFFIVTVRDRNSGKVAAQGGYGQVHSGSKEQEITLYRAGTYHINIEARQIHVDFKILTADAPLLEETVMPSGQATPNPYEMWEYF
ncbi:hypothetical protein ABH15_09030 [Methanoculleus taiwanensis]|uniref:Uncharacterized protein n=1 Tax=Methanoculleus taiwanensis TaxID=1550565 RepID=A0A498H1L8_9EURY|nr:hypothetical protein [Methanoculleus taiwanensis]RXE56267.1 hypothetical protein ABH15_09030 [Methanoculleus taiwanensis]